MTRERPGGGPLGGLDPHLARPFEAQALLGGVALQFGSERGLEVCGIAREVTLVDEEGVLVGSGRPGLVIEPGEVGLAGETAGDLGGMEPTGEDAAGDALEEALEPALQTANHVHPRQVTVSPLMGDYQNTVADGTIRYRISGRVAELADAQDSGSCDRKIVGVQVPPRPR